MAAVVIGLLVPEPSAAHAPQTAAEALYSGSLGVLLHPFVLLPLVALGVFFGQHHRGAFTLPLSVFAAAGAVGAILGQILTPFMSVVPGLLGIAVAISLLSALWPRAPLLAGLVAAALAGIPVALIATPPAGQPLLTGLSLLASLTATLLVLGGTASAVSLLLRHAPAAWVRIGVRIIASWTAAIAALLLSLTLFGPP